MKCNFFMKMYLNIYILMPFSEKNLKERNQSMDEFVTRYGKRGARLADALTYFSYDIVGIVAQYAYELNLVQKFNIPSMDEEIGNIVVSNLDEIYISSGEHLRKYDV